MPYAFTIVGLVCIIALGELILWRLLVRRIDSLSFHARGNADQLPFSHMHRLRALAALHGIALILITILPILWLW